MQKLLENRTAIDEKSKIDEKIQVHRGLGGFSLPSASWEAFGRPLRAKSWPTWRQVGSQK